MKEICRFWISLKVIGLAVLDMNQSDWETGSGYHNQSDWTVLDIHESDWSVLDITESDWASGSEYP